MAILTEKERNLLPDSDFAAVYTTISRKNGRTSRTKTRKLPIHDAEHVKNAMSRLGKTELPPKIKSGAHQKIVAAAKKYGMGID